MPTRRAVMAAGAAVLATGGARAATPPVRVLQGAVTAANFPRFEAFVSGSLDKVIGLKLRVDKSGEGDALQAYEDGGMFVTYLKAGQQSEISARGGFDLSHGAYAFDGFFLVKGGGMHQGILSYALQPVDEAKVRLSGAKLVPVTLPAAR